MRDWPECPLCGSSNWEVIGERVYSQGNNGQISRYQKARLDILFQIWLPGRNSVTLRSGLCGECGFVTNLPRPEASDLDAKYHFLEEQLRDYGELETEAVEQERSEALWSLLKKSLRQRATVLDFGGGDGRLMKRFADQGHVCLLVDYNQSPRHFVKKIASTLDELPADLFVDAIICSHVMEHVADPVGDMRELRKHLKTNGMIVVEVPLEIWKRPPLHDEPVTHINFFTRASLRRALEAADFSVQNCNYVGSLHPTGRIMPAIRAQAIRRHPVTIAPSSGVREAKLLLKPRVFQKLQRWWFMCKSERKMYSNKS